MTAVRHPTGDRAAWLERRRQSINASEVGALFGISPFMTPLDLYLAKLNGSEIPDTSLMRRGRWLELAAQAALADEKPDWKCRAAGFFIIDPERRMGATPDLLTATDEPVEVKAPTPQSFERDWQDGPPLHYQLQALAQAMLLDASRAWIAALVVDGYDANLHVYEVPRHAEAEARIHAGVTAFWSRVEKQEPPDAIFGADAESLAALYPREIAGKKVDLSGKNMLPELLDERDDLKAQIKAAEDRVSEIDDEIKAAMGDAEIGVTADGRTITWRLQHRSAIPATRFRVLRVSRFKERKDAA